MSTIQPATTYSAILGQVLQSIRDERGIDQTSLATTLGISQGALSRIENGTSVMSTDQLHAAAFALGTTPSAIVHDADVAESDLKRRGVQVTPRKRADASMAMITGAALGALLAAILLKKG